MLTWTPELVADSLIAAYQRVNVGVSSPRGYTVGDRIVPPEAVAEAVAAFRWPDRFLTDGRDRRYLRNWASCRASGESMRERCRDLDWPRSTAERRRLAALATIARGLNATPRIDAGLTVGPSASEPV